MKEEKIAYEAPKIITYSEDSILEELGSPQACSPDIGCGAMPN